MFDRLKASIRAQAFHLGLLGLLVNPFYFARKGLHQHIVALAPSVHGRLLDVVAAPSPIKNTLYSEYIGLDMQGRNKHADRFYDGKTFPFSDGEFDAVLTSEVLEHVFNPDEFLSEINRVLRDGGVLLLTVPFVWDEHEQPFGYAPYSSFGLRHLLESHGFEIIEHGKTMDDIRVIFQLVNAYIYKKTVTGSWRTNLLLTVILMAPFNVLGELFARILPNNSDFYLDNIILARSAKGTF
jgi:SAM-dependent methyltransferase